MMSPEEAKANEYDPDTIAQIELDDEARKEAAQLILQIEAAFAGIPRPAATLSVARGYDDEWILSEDRVLELNAQDPEMTWQEVTDASIQACQEYFFFSDAEGWRFYLPAYMCHYLRDFPDAGWDAAYWACVSLDHVDLLDEAQLRCVDHFVQLCHKYEGL